jgi:predicted small lipoprotein YifL
MHTARRLPGAVLILAAATLPACGGSGPTEMPPSPSIAGTWNYSAANASGSGASCDINNLILTLQRNGNTLTGTGSGGTLSCSGSGQPYSQQLNGDTIADGLIDDNGNLTFDLETSDIHNVGLFDASASTLQGDVYINVDLGPPTGVVTVHGTFVGIRQ